jgi:hypothetical protein
MARKCKVIQRLLQKAVNAIVTRKHPGRMLVGDEAIAWLTGAGLGHAKIATATGDQTGFGPEGVSAIGVAAQADEILFKFISDLNKAAGNHLREVVNLRLSVFVFYCGPL